MFQTLFLFPDRKSVLSNPVTIFDIAKNSYNLLKTSIKILIMFLVNIRARLIFLNLYLLKNNFLQSYQSNMHNNPQDGT